MVQIYTQDEHVSSFAELAKRAATFNPIMIVSHSAKDSMSVEDQYVFFEKPRTLEEEIGISERKRHEDWWLKICNRREKEGVSYITFTPEFGPAPEYMHALPFTNQPVTDLWRVCLTMGEHFKQLYNDGGKIHAADKGV